MELQNIESRETVEFIEKLDGIMNSIKKTLANRTLVLNGERYLTNADLCGVLHISLRTLQEFRDTGKIGYIKISGKILYSESDILKWLEDNYVSPVRY